MKKAQKILNTKKKKKKLACFVFFCLGWVGLAFVFVFVFEKKFSEFQQKVGTWRLAFVWLGRQLQVCHMSDAA